MEFNLSGAGLMAGKLCAPSRAFHTFIPTCFKARLVAILVAHLMAGLVAGLVAGLLACLLSLAIVVFHQILLKFLVTGWHILNILRSLVVLCLRVTAQAAGVGCSCFVERIVGRFVLLMLQLLALKELNVWV